MSATSSKSFSYEARGALYGISLAILFGMIIFTNVVCAENLLKNGDFSHGMSRWGIYTWGSSERGRTHYILQKEDVMEKVSELDRDVRKGGVCSHKIFIPDEKPLNWTGYSTITEVSPNTTYHFSCWVQGEDIHGGRGVNVHIKELNSKGEVLSNISAVENLFGSFRWSKIEKDITTGPETVGLMISEAVMMHGTVWFDEFNLVTDSGIKPDKDSDTKEFYDNNKRIEEKFNFSPTGDRDIVINYKFSTSQEKAVFINEGEWNLSDCIGVRFSYKGDGSNRTFEIGLKDVKGKSHIIGFGNLRSKEEDAIWRIDLTSISFYDADVKEIFLTINNKDGKEPQGSIIFNNIEFLFKGTLNISEKEKKMQEDIFLQLKKTVPTRKAMRVMPNLSMIYTKPVIPEDYPNFKDEKVKPVTRLEAGYGLHGMTQSDPQYLDWYYKFYNFGDAIKPYYWYVDNPNWKETIKELLQRDLYIVGVSGYAPEDDPAGTHFAITDEKQKWIIETAGKYFVGYEDGEQDNRFLPSCRGNTKQESYEDFKSFSATVSKDLQNYTVTLATHPLIHYYGAFGSRLLGYEFDCVGLPSDILRFSFLRGAGKEYGRLIQAVMSVWGQGGLKTYNRRDTRGNPDAGPSLSLLRRQFYLSYIYGCSFAGLEYSQFTNEWKDGKPELSPLGKMNLDALDCFKNHPERGVPYSPIGLVLDFYHGWQSPVEKGRLITWGHLPYQKGDFQIYNIFRQIFPYYEDHPMALDERGSLTVTPYGDIFEVLTDDASEYVIKMYNSLVIMGENEIKDDFEKRLKSYVEEGGQVVLFYPQIIQTDPKFLGFTVGSEIKEAAGSSTLYDQNIFIEPCGYVYMPVIPTTAEIIAINENQDPLITVNNYGKGKVICITAEYGMSKELKYAYPSLSYAEPKYDLLNVVKHFLVSYFKDHNLIEIKGGEIQYLTNLTQDKNEIVLTLVNNRNKIWKGEVSVPGTKILQGTEWLKGDSAMINGDGKLETSVEPLDLRIYTLKCASSFWPK